MKEEGVIKYYCDWKQGVPLPESTIAELNAWRHQLYDCGLIGVTADGIGYGNVSIRFGQDQFIISGSGTGHFPTLGAGHYTVVTGYSVQQNKVTSVGPIEPSSESLTHALIYQCAPDVHAVLHVHHRQLWEQLMVTFPATHKDISYGTVEMANEIVRLFRETRVAQTRLFAMGGHDSGIIAFGKDLEEAGGLLLEVGSRYNIRLP